MPCGQDKATDPVASHSLAFQACPPQAQPHRITPSATPSAGGGLKQFTFDLNRPLIKPLRPFFAGPDEERPQGLDEICSGDSSLVQTALGRMPGPFGTSGLTLRNRSHASPHSRFTPTRPHPIKPSPPRSGGKGIGCRPCLACPDRPQGIHHIAKRPIRPFQPPPNPIRRAASPDTNTAQFPGGDSALTLR